MTTRLTQNTPDLAPERILLIEDDPSFGTMLNEALGAKGYAVTRATRAEDALGILQKTNTFDVILTDVNLPGMTGLEAIPQLRELAPATDIIVMTAYSTKEMAIEAVRQGAYDFFSKPFSLSELEIVIRRCMEKRRLQGEVSRLRNTLRREGPTSRIIGTSEAINEVKQRIEKIAPLETTVLILGESGTGKELISDTIHALSPRAGKPFVKVNCAAIPENLFENELFGHEKGAFTGAGQMQQGKFEVANHGTILLDEIGDMPLSIQPKLLRVVEQKQVERLGARHPIDLDVRIIAATNQQLEDRIKEKLFREDLYYRLNVAVINLPPLRQRKQDIPMLADFFLNRIRNTLQLDLPDIPANAMQMLQAYDWPGNVRQFANVLEGLAISASPGPISPEAVQNATGASGSSPLLTASDSGIDLKETLRKMERSLILNALRKTQGNQKSAAALLSLSPKNLWAKMSKHGIDSKHLS